MRRRSLIFVTVMSIITLGIYDIYWAFSTRNELTRKGLKVPSPWIVLLPLLGLIGVAIMQIIVHLSFNSTSSVIPVINVISVIVGVLSVVGIIPMSIYWAWKYSQAVGEVTKEALSAEVCFVTALVLNVIGFGFIWPIVVQHHFNRVAETS